MEAGPNLLAEDVVLHWLPLIFNSTLAFLCVWNHAITLFSPFFMPLFPYFPGITRLKWRWSTLDIIQKGG
jgi:hypothetical protein